ncbi:winged helix-turn-helix domain-containing protein [Thermodesulfobacteriota bacterium]
MSQIDQDKKEKKDALKMLRKERKEWIVKTSGVMRAQKKAIKAIKTELKINAGTVPLIAEATGISTDQVLWYIAALKKYGKIVEGEKDGRYFQYILVNDAQEEESNNDIEKSLETSDSS